jgi:membrane-associated phospholipid phosphatase
MLAAVAVLLVAEAPQSPDVYNVDPWLNGAIIGTSALGIGVSAALTPVLVTPHCPCDPRTVNPIDRIAIGMHSNIADWASNIEVGVALAGPVVLDVFDVGWSRALFDDTVIYVETLAVNGVLVSAAKLAFQRPEPMVYAGINPSSKSLYDSFYSGHVALAAGALATASMTYSLRHGAALWPWVATLVLGASIAVERVAAGAHFPTDVVAGFVEGAAVGVAVPSLHAAGDASRATLAVTPVAGGAVVAMQLQL